MARLYHYIHKGMAGYTASLRVKGVQSHRHGHRHGRRRGRRRHARSWGCRTGSSGRVRRSYAHGRRRTPSRRHARTAPVAGRSPRPRLRPGRPGRSHACRLDHPITSSHINSVQPTPSPRPLAGTHARHQRNTPGQPHTPSHSPTNHWVNSWLQAPTGTISRGVTSMAHNLLKHSGPNGWANR